MATYKTVITDIHDFIKQYKVNKGQEPEKILLADSAYLLLVEALKKGKVIAGLKESNGELFYGNVKLWTR
jgi:hypothetical protein